MTVLWTDYEVVNHEWLTSTYTGQNDVYVNAPSGKQIVSGWAWVEPVGTPVWVGPWIGSVSPGQNNQWNARIDFGTGGNITRVVVTAICATIG